MDDQIITQLESQIDVLLQLCDRLNAENRALKAKEHQWHEEKTELIEKNETTANKIQNMISRLKAMEHNE